MSRGSIEQALAECADLARSEVLLRYPTTFKASIPDAVYQEKLRSRLPADHEVLRWERRFLD